MSIDLTQFWLDRPAYAQNPNKEYAIYGIQYALVANALQQDGNFVTGMDADFVMTAMFGTITTAVTNAAYLVFPLIINIVYTGKNRNITAIPLEWTTITGTQANPRIYLPYPIVIPKATQVDVFITNTQAATPLSVSLAFHGIKIFC